MRRRQRSRIWLCAAGAAGQLACAGLGLRPGDRAANDVEIRPDAPPEYDLLVAQQHMLDGEAAEGLAAYQRAVEKDETSAFLHRRVAAALAQQNRLDEATAHAQRALELEPGDPETRLFLGQLYRLRHDLPAVETTLRTESGEPIDPDAAFLLFQVYFEANRWTRRRPPRNGWWCTSPRSCAAASRWPASTSARESCRNPIGPCATR